MDGDPKLTRLLEHPAIWRGRSAARLAVLSSGFTVLDERLPGKGWPRSGLIEILIGRFGSGELYLLLPALAAAGVVLDRVAVVGGAKPLWAFEQVLRSGACDAALAWARQPKMRELRRLQLAAERGRTLGVLFRPRSAARESSPAVLRLGLAPCAAGVRVTLLKGRSADRGSFELAWPHE